MNKETKSTKILRLPIDDFIKICGEKNVLTLENEMERYSHDETEHLKFLPGVVLKPRTAQEISEILKICNRERIPVTPRGAGTGLSGGALPNLGGVVIAKVGS